MRNHADSLSRATGEILALGVHIALYQVMQALTEKLPKEAREELHKKATKKGWVTDLMVEGLSQANMNSRLAQGLLEEWLNCDDHSAAEEVEKFFLDMMYDSTVS